MHSENRKWMSMCTLALGVSKPEHVHANSKNGCHLRTYTWGTQAGA